ncbi:hypothetical protein OKJ48_17685 [Streptomyces kunmingensis]|uniref:Uncharacterized protein n=1 Tax=Streptomyces kunmingensis TaxID=68225 RepID=A0ABU6CBH9_9ACTN|nr:hypothetical protein [Streptomyces kunmingensis]MEB3962065.1 hypothetical protein [Streptomyces kunmingensis]
MPLIVASGADKNRARPERRETGFDCHLGEVDRHTAREQTQRLVQRDRLAVTGIPVETQHASCGDSMSKCFGDLAELMGQDQMRARYIQAYSDGERRVERRLMGFFVRACRPDRAGCAPKMTRP